MSNTYLNNTHRSEQDKTLIPGNSPEIPEKDGYKLTKLGWIPEDWYLINLKGACNLIKDGTHLPPKRSKEGPLLLSVQNLINGHLRETIDDTRVPWSFYTSMHKNWKPEVGDVLLAVVGATIGKTAQVPSEFPDFTIQRSIAIFRGSPDHLINKYLRLFLDSNIFTRQLWKRVNQTAQPGIYLSELNKIKIPIPSLSEQRVIVNIFSTWDIAIEKLQKLIELKELHKKGLMQQLLTGKRRLPQYSKNIGYLRTKYDKYPSDWNYIEIGEIASEVSIKNKNGYDLPVLSSTKYDGLVDSLKYFGKRIFSENTSTYKIVNRHQFAYATNHIEEGSIGYQDLYDKALISPMYTAFESSTNVNDDFLYRLLKTDLLMHIYQTNTSASVDRRGSLRWKEFSKIRIALPTKEEQDKISHVLKTADTELDLLIRKLERLKLQKKGLMQVLLTGKIRVKTNLT